MFKPTPHSITEDMLATAVLAIPDIDFRLAINQPTGDFFYDAWAIKPEFKGSIWEDILAVIPDQIGEARLIKLEPGTCYRSHADIDDRWHLSVICERAYLINLENDQMHPTIADCQWHEINTGLKHSAVNFGSRPRVQLVVRKLLTRGSITTPVNISITLKEVVEDRRFIFDDIVSPWLNRVNKQGLLDNFKYSEFEVTMTIDRSVLKELEETISSHFNLTVK